MNASAVAIEATSETASGSALDESAPRALNTLQWRIFALETDPRTGCLRAVPDPDGTSVARNDFRAETCLSTDGHTGVIVIAGLVPEDEDPSCERLGDALQALIKQVLLPDRISWHRVHWVLGPCRPYCLSPRLLEANYDSETGRIECLPTTGVDIDALRAALVPQRAVAEIAHDTEDPLGRRSHKASLAEIDESLRLNDDVDADF